MAPEGKAIAFAENPRLAYADELFESSSSDFGFLGADFRGDHCRSGRKSSSEASDKLLRRRDDKLPGKAESPRPTVDFPALAGLAIWHSLTTSGLFQMCRGRGKGVRDNSGKYPKIFERD